MNGKFTLDQYRNFIIEFKNDDVKIFATDHNDYPTLPLFLMPFNDINQKYLNIDKIFIDIINAINVKYPILKISYEEKIIVTKNHKLFLISKNNNKYNVTEILVDYTIENEKSTYSELLYKMSNGEQVNIDGYLIDLNIIQKCVNNDSIINSIKNEKAKETLFGIVDVYKQQINNKLSAFANNEVKSNSSNTDEKYSILYNKLINGQTINIGNFILSYEILKQIVLDENIINQIHDQEIKDILLKLITIYKNDKNNYEEITGGSSDSKAKVKRRAGFANKMFMISLACFSFGIIVALIVVVLNKFVF